MTNKNDVVHVVEGHVDDDDQSDTLPALIGSDDVPEHVEQLRRIQALVDDGFFEDASFTVELDVVFDQPHMIDNHDVARCVDCGNSLDEAIMLWLEGTSNDDLTNKIEVKIVNYRGGGGWPVVRLTGQPGSVASMLARWNGDE